MENNRKDPRRQLIGAVSKALGQQFERDINAAFDHYRRLGVASIEKTPEPFHMTGRENGGKVVKRRGRNASEVRHKVRNRPEIYAPALVPPSVCH